MRSAACSRAARARSPPTSSTQPGVSCQPCQRDDLSANAHEGCPAAKEDQRLEVVTQSVNKREQQGSHPRRAQALARCSQSASANSFTFRAGELACLPASPAPPTGQRAGCGGWRTPRRASRSTRPYTRGARLRGLHQCQRGARGPGKSSTARPAQHQRYRRYSSNLTDPRERRRPKRHRPNSDTESGRSEVVRLDVRAVANFHGAVSRNNLSA